MAVFFRGLDATELPAFTLGMRDSGTVLDWSGLDRPVLDKHSTGGVGDKVSLLLAPIIAACGGAVPMLSGRGPGPHGRHARQARGDPRLRHRARQRPPARASSRRWAARSSARPTTSRRPTAGCTRRATRPAASSRSRSSSPRSSPRSSRRASARSCSTSSTAPARSWPSCDDARDLARGARRRRGRGGPAHGRAAHRHGQRARRRRRQRAGGARVHRRPHRSRRPGPAARRGDARALRVLLELGGLDADPAAALHSGAAAERFAAMVAGLGGPADLLERPDAHLPVAPVTLAVEPATCRHRDVARDARRSASSVLAPRRRPPPRGRSDRPRRRPRRDRRARARRSAPAAGRSRSSTRATRRPPRRRPTRCARRSRSGTMPRAPDPSSRRTSDERRRRSPRPSCTSTSRAPRRRP